MVTRRRRRYPPKVVPYNPNARDADNDGVVQEGTIWERPGGARFVDRAGNEISSALRRAEGATMVDREGNPITGYVPLADRGGTPGERSGTGQLPGAERPQLGPTIGEQGGIQVNAIAGTIGGGIAAPAPRDDGPEIPEPEITEVPADTLPRLSFDKDSIDQERLSQGLLVVAPEDTITGRGISAAVNGVVEREDLPETLYHITTAKDAVRESGALRINAGGLGLGGGETDKLSVSLTADRQVAKDLFEDMNAYGSHMRRNPTPQQTFEFLQDWAKRNGWEYSPNAGSGWTSKDYWNDFYFARSRLMPDRDTTDGKKVPPPRNPLIFGDQQINPDQLELLEIPREAIPESALVTDFDLGSEYGLEEVRVWGDVPLEVPKITARSLAGGKSTSGFEPDEERLVHVGGDLYMLDDFRVGQILRQKHGEDGVEPMLETMETVQDLKRSIAADDPERRRFWDHPGRIDSESETARALSFWRSDFLTSAALKGILRGQEPPAAYDDYQSRKMARDIKEALDSAPTLDLPQYRVQTWVGELEEGKEIDFNAVSGAVIRSDAEDYVQSTRVFGGAVTGSKPVLFVFPEDARGIYHDDPTDLPRESIITGNYRVKKVEPVKLGGFETQKVELEYVGKSELLSQATPLKPAPTPPKFYEPFKPSYSGRVQEIADEVDSWEDFVDRLEAENFVTFDYETTGFLDEGGLPVQIGGVRMVDGEPQRFNLYMNPGIPVSEWSDFSQRSLRDPDGNPITQEFIDQQPSMEEAHRLFADWLGESPILGAHNYDGFDGPLLGRMFADYGIETNIAGTIDTLNMSRDLYKKKNSYKPDQEYEVESHRLKDLADHFDVELEGWHTADADSMATHNLLRAMARDADEKGKDIDLLRAETQQERYEGRRKWAEEAYGRAEAAYRKAQQDRSGYRVETPGVARVGGGSASSRARSGEQLAEAAKVQEERLEALKEAGLPMMRGMMFSGDSKLTTQIRERMAPPTEESQIGRELELGQMILDAIDQRGGIGSHWTTSPQMASLAATTDQLGASVIDSSKFPVLFFASPVDKADLSLAPDPTGVLTDEKEITLAKGARVNIEAIWIRQGSSWRIIFGDQGGFGKMPNGGEDFTS